MPYTRVWSITRPPGSEQAKNIDNEIRFAREDVAERMASFTDDWAADPVVAKDTILGNVTGKKLLIPHTAFVTDGGNYNDNYFVELESFGPCRAPLILPVGVTITLVEFLVDFNNISSGQITHALKKVSFLAAPALATVYSLTPAGSGITILASGALSETVANNVMYTLSLDAAGGGVTSFRVYGARVTYDTPDCRKTI